MESDRIVITGLGLTSPLGDNLADVRKNLLEGRPNIEMIDVRYMGMLPAGVCHYDPLKYQKRKYTYCMYISLIVLIVLQLVWIISTSNSLEGEGHFLQINYFFWPVM